MIQQQECRTQQGGLADVPRLVHDFGSRVCPRPRTIRLPVHWFLGLFNGDVGHRIGVACGSAFRDQPVGVVDGEQIAGHTLRGESSDEQ
jgi:hypothetical protein